MRPKKPSYFRTPLYMAVQNDDIELVQYLIDAGANLDIKGPGGQ